MIGTWVAFIDAAEWTAAPGGNPFAAFDSLYRGALALAERDDADSPTNSGRLLAITRTIERRVRELCPRLSDDSEQRDQAVVRLALPTTFTIDVSQLPGGLPVMPPDHPDALRTRALAGTRFGGHNDVWAVLGRDNFAGDPGPCRPETGDWETVERRVQPLSLGDVPASNTDLVGFTALLESAVATASAGAPFMPGRAADATLIETLWCLVHSTSAPGELLVRFNDSSIATVQITVEHLTEVNDVVAEPALQSGLMSLRHPELDAPCAFYWFRNETLSGCDRLADAADAASAEARARLSELARASGGRPLAIDLHLTGFHPAIVGLVDALCTYQGPTIDLALTPLLTDTKARRPMSTWRLRTP